MARIAALEADPAAYAEQVASELGEVAGLDGLAELADQDARLRHALGQIDGMIERAARIRLDHVLADDASIGAPTRKVFATTIVSYAGRLALLEDRARDVAARGGAADPGGVAARICDAAQALLALRDALRAGVLDVIRAQATAAAAIADRAARDRRRDEPERRRWSAMRRELEAVASQPERVAGAAMADRLAAWPSQLDEPDPASEPTFADMIELD